MIDGPLVSVVVPAYNAAGTIQETLDSISQQTYHSLEVIVVDDGSIDGTAAIARRHGRGDPRFSVISKANGGVASARNEGIRASKGDYVAFIDADDLWHPTKIAKQMAMLLSGGPDMALVYSPFRLIDADGKVFASPRKYGVSGWVLHRHFHTNLVGNGSALLIRRSVLEEFHGFDPWLLQQGAEGCEDLLLQLRIAVHYRFGEVSEYLVGYRRLPSAMSANAEQMVRSGILAVNKALSECSDIPGLSASAMLKRYEWQRLKASVKKGRARETLQSFAWQFLANPAFVTAALWTDFRAIAAKLFRAANRLRQQPDSGKALPHFYDLDPKAGIELDQRTAMSRALRRLARHDEAYRPKSKAGTDRSARSSPDGSLERSMLGAFGQRELGSSCKYQKG
ncbi:MAG TPA: glycosyltransferase family A protein [Dongiaceae bacterium]|jgi:glycosyltransferase involved in cell wall biosynthesis|nr:glycosyltransferase family A protein [Dongiaceae bacterium]